MPLYFFDSSGLVKRYVYEAGTAWVIRILDPSAGNNVHLVRLTGVEVVAAMTRRVRSSTLSATALRQFRAEFKHRWRILGMTAALIDQAMIMADRHALRAYDAAQLAAALRVQARYRAVGQLVTLVSADAELNAAATAEGLIIEDPNQHP
jgi:uncharacterized protein